MLMLRNFCKSNVVKVTLLTGIFLATLILQTVATAGVAQASGVVGNGTAASCNEAALDAKLAGGGNVSFNCGLNPLTITVTSQKIISANTTIDGGGLITLSGGGTTRILQNAYQNSMTVKNLNFINGNATKNGSDLGNGGAIYSVYRANLTVLNCKFYNNNSRPATTTSDNYDVGGGAIFTQGGTLTVDQSDFNNNFVDKGSGGAIHGLRSNMLITRSNFAANRSNDRGGGIYYDGALDDPTNSFIIIEDSTFSDNSGYFEGGGVKGYMYQGQDYTKINRSSFTNNSIKLAAGNVGGLAGGLKFGNGKLDVTNTVFSGNSVYGMGGAIAVTEDALVTITNVTMDGNSAYEKPGGNGNYNDSGLGGGMFLVNNSQNFVITNSTIANNFAGWVGGGLSTSDKGTLRNTIIANNKANNGGNNWKIQYNCSTTLTNGGNNIEFPDKNPNDGNDRYCAAGVTVADPKLGPLADNRGPTKTMAISPGSPAIDNGNNATCPTIDQRGTSRPRDGGTGKGAICDIGAFEYVANPSIVVTSTSDDGTGKPGTLSQAINQANTDPTLLSIILSPRNITVTGKLPALPKGITLDGGASSCNNKVVLDGTNAPVDAIGLSLSGGNIIRAVNVTHFKKAQIKTSGNGNRFICSKAVK